MPRRVKSCTLLKPKLRTVTRVTRHLEPPQSAVPSSNGKWSAHNSGRKWQKKRRCRATGLVAEGRSLGVSTCKLLANGWYNTFSIVNTFYINEMSLVNKFLVSGTVLKWQKTRLNFVPIESEFVLDPPSFPFYRHLLKTAAALDILPRHAVIC